MASGFSNIHFKPSLLGSKYFQDLIKFFDKNNATLYNEDGNVNCVDNEGERFQCDESFIEDCLSSKMNISFFLNISEYGALYLRIRQASFGFVEEYGFDWLSDTVEKDKVAALLKNRITECASNMGQYLYGAVLDKSGYLEDVDWDKYFVNGEESQLPYLPEVLCIQKDILFTCMNNNINDKPLKAHRIITPS